MSVLSSIRRHLGVKLFITYLLIIVVTMISLAVTAELALPTAFGRHLALMAESMGSGPAMAEDLWASFQRAVTESGGVAGLVALLLAVALATYVSRRVSVPIERMMAASQRIADGHYEERVSPGGEAREQDELGQLATNFDVMAAALERTERTRLDLIGNVAHELRTPLTSIKGYMEGLIDGVLPAETETFERIYREADRLQRLVYDLQELSRVESGAFRLDIKKMTVAALVQATADRLCPQFQEKSVTLDADIPAGLEIRADEDRLGQVLLNLVGNALQYTPSEGRVTVRAGREQGRVWIAVCDTGVGISAEHLSRIFERFYRVDNSRARVGGGSGIGLTIARHLVEAHGGTIAARSDGPGRGSTFRFTIPAA